MITLEDRFEVNTDAIFTRLDEEEAVILHLQTRQYYTLNETGILIWEHLERHLSVGEIARALSESYEIEIEEASGHVTDFLATLQQDELIRKYTGAQSSTGKE